MNYAVGRMLALEQADGFPFRHIHAVGSYGWDWMGDFVKDQGVDLAKAPRIEMKEYLYNMPTVMAAADVMISRAGASTCNEIAAAGIPCVLIPPQRDGQSSGEKRPCLGRGGGAEVLLEKDCTAQALYGMVTDLLKDPEKRRGMRAALHKWPSRIRRSASAILTGWPPENDKKERWPWIQKEQRRPAPAEEGHRRQNARREKPVQNARTRQTRSRTAPQTRRPSGGRCGSGMSPRWSTPRPRPFPSGGCCCGYWWWRRWPGPVPEPVHFLQGQDRNGGRGGKIHPPLVRDGGLRYSGGRKSHLFEYHQRSRTVLKALPYVESVQVGIKLPDTVNIEIKEYEVAYAIRDQGGFWWRITSDGKVLEQVNGGQATENAQILGVVLVSPVVNEQAVAGKRQLRQRRTPTRPRNPRRPWPLSPASSSRPSGSAPFSVF